MLQDIPPDEVGVGTMLSNSSAMCIALVGIVNAGNPRGRPRSAGRCQARPPGDVARG